MKRIAMCVGLNMVDPDQYGGWPGHLNAAVNDAVVLASYFARGGMDSRQFIDSVATLDVVIGQFESAAKTLVSGDALVFTFSGHGNTSPVFSDEDKQSICLYDGELSDQKFRQLLSAFVEGVRIVVIIDSCFSGGMDRARQVDRARRLTRFQPFGVKAKRRVRADARIPDISAAVLELTASSSQETSGEDLEHGFFTLALVESLDGFTKAGAPMPTYEEWFNDTRQRMSLAVMGQHPQAHQLGPMSVFPSTVFTFDVRPTPPQPPPVFPDV